MLTYLSDAAGARIARKYDTKFKHEFTLLKRFPGMGSLKSEFGPETRLLTVYPYLIF